MQPREEHRLIWKDSTSDRSLPLDQGLTIREQARKEAGDAGVEGRRSWKCIQGKPERVDDPGPSISTSTQPWLCVNTTLLPQDLHKTLWRAGE